MPVRLISARQFFLQRRIVRIGVVLVQGQQQRFLGQLGHPLKVAANADAQHHGRARVRARVAHGLQHHPFHARQAVGRGKHFQLAHVLAAKPLGATVSFSVSPGTSCTCRMAGVLSPVFTRRKGSPTTDLRSSPSV